MALEASEVAVRVRLVGGSAFQAEADKVSASTERIGTAGKAANDKAALAGAGVVGFGSKLDKVSSKMKSFGKGLTEATLPLAAMGLYASKTASSFNALMTQLVTQSNLPRKNLQGLTKDVLALSGAVAQSPNNLAQGLQNIVGAGIRNNAQAMRVLKESGQMATVGGDTVSDTSNALTSIISSGLAKHMSFAQVAGYIEAAIGHSKMSMSDITSAMNTSILPEAKMTHTSLAQVLATAAALSREGINPATEMSRLRLTMTSALSPTAMGRQAMQTLKLAPMQLASDLQHGGLLNMLADLKVHANRLPGGFSGMDADNLIAQIFGKSRGMGNIAALLEKLPELDSIYSAVLQTGTPALWQKHFSETMQTPQAKQAAARAKLDASLITLGNTINQQILPVLLRLVGPVTSVLNAYGKLPKPLQNVIMMGVAASAILGPMLMLGSKLLDLGGVVGGLVLGEGGMTMLAGSVGMAAVSFATFVPALAAAGAALWLFSGSHAAKNVRHAVGHAGYDVGAWLKNNIGHALGITGMNKTSETYHKELGFENSSYFRSLSPIARDDLKALFGSIDKTGHAQLTAGDINDFATANHGKPIDPNKIPIISQAVKDAIKQGMKEAEISVYLPNGRVLAKEVNSTNRKSQNRR